MGYGKAASHVDDEAVDTSSSPKWADEHPTSLPGNLISTCLLQMCFGASLDRDQFKAAQSPSRHIPAELSVLRSNRQKAHDLSRGMNAVNQ